MTESECIEKLTRLVGQFWGGGDPFVGGDDRNRAAIAAEARDTLVAWRRTGVQNQEVFKLFDQMIRRDAEAARSMLDAYKGSELASYTILAGGSGWASADDVVAAFSGGTVGDECGYEIVAEIRGDTLALGNGEAAATIPIQDGQVDLEKVGLAFRQLR